MQFELESRSMMCLHVLAGPVALLTDILEIYGNNYISYGTHLAPP